MSAAKRTDPASFYLIEMHSTLTRQNADLYVSLLTACPAVPR